MTSAMAIIIVIDMTNAPPVTAPRNGPPRCIECRACEGSGYEGSSLCPDCQGSGELAHSLTCDCCPVSSDPIVHVYLTGEAVCEACCTRLEAEHAQDEREAAENVALLEASLELVRQAREWRAKASARVVGAMLEGRGAA